LEGRKKKKKKEEKSQSYTAFREQLCRLGFAFILAGLRRSLVKSR